MTTKRAAVLTLSLIAGLALVLGALAWFTPIATAVHLTPGLTTLSKALLHVAAIAQTAFVGLWMTRPWYRSEIGRALMFKSLTLAVYLDYALIALYVGERPESILVGAALFTLVTLGILAQAVTMALLLRRTRSEDHDPVV